MQAHLPETRSYWFHTSSMRLSTFSLCFFLVFVHFLTSSRSVRFFLFFIIFSHIFTHLSSPSLHPRYSLTSRIHFCCFTFIIESFAQPVCRASNSTPSSYAEGSSLRSRGTASKNDYSEINNNDITARRRSIRARGNGFRRLTWILPVCDVWCPHWKLHDNKRPVSSF